MRELIYFIAGGLTFIAVVVLWFWRTYHQAARPAIQSDVRQLTSCSSLNLLPIMAVENVFALRDWDFVSQLGHRKIMQLYMRERRAIGISWFVALRRRAWSLLRVYVGVARHETHLSLSQELRVLTAFLGFFSLHTVGLFLLRLAGPVWFRRISLGVASAATRRFLTGTAMLEFLEPRVYAP